MPITKAQQHPHKHQQINHKPQIKKNNAVCPTLKIS